MRSFVCSALAAGLLALGVFSLGGCTDTEDKTKKAANPEEVVGFRPLVGRWASDTGALPGLGNRWVSLTIASDGQYIFEMRGMGPRTEIVYYGYRGELSIGSNGLYSGRVYHQPDELGVMSSFSLDAPQNGSLRMNGDGKAVQLSYRGL